MSEDLRGTAKNSKIQTFKNSQMISTLDRTSKAEGMAVEAITNETESQFFKSWQRISHP